MRKKKSSIVAAICIFLAAVLLIGETYIRKINYKASDSVISLALSEEADRAKEPVKLIAHRGFSGIAPENTLAAVKAAGKAGYYGCEFDIRLTADDRWVVMHNNDVKAMTDGEGLISEMNYHEVRALHIDAGNNIEQYPNEKIPTLEEMLDACRENGLNPVIEIKLESDQIPDYIELARMIRAKGFADCTVISFSMEALTKLKAKLPSATYWFLTQKVTTKTIAECTDNGIAGIDFNASKIGNFRYINAMKKSKLEVGAWTVDNIRLLDALCSEEVYYITTNRITPV